MRLDMSDSDITVRISPGIPVLEREASPAASMKPESFAPQRSERAALLQQIFSFPALLGAVLVAAAATSARAFSLDPDVWWHLKSGEAILTTHHWPTADPYSFTVAGQYWLSYEWLGDVMLATAWRMGGLVAFGLLLTILSGAIILALYALGTMRSRNSKAGFVAAAMLFVPAAASFNLRPQMLGYLFIVLTLIILERFRMGKRAAVWLLPALMLVWINAHGSWIIGLGTIAVYLACGLVEFRVGAIEARRWNGPDRLSLSIVLALSTVVTLITPYGAGLAKYPFEVASSLPISIGNIQEWQPMPFDTSLGKVFLFLFLGFVLLQVTFQFTWRLEELGLFLFATTMACIHVRFLMLFVPFFVPLLAVTLARWLPTYQRAKDKYLLNAVLMLAILAIVVRYFPSKASLERTIEGRFPVGAVAYLNDHSVPGPMYNAYFFGGYLVWSWAPGRKVFIDGRSELYERGGVIGDVVNVMDIRPDALAILKKYGVQSCLLLRDEPLATVLAAMPDWKQEYEDQTSILFVRRSAGNAD